MKVSVLEVWWWLAYMWPDDKHRLSIDQCNNTAISPPQSLLWTHQLSPTSKFSPSYAAIKQWERRRTNASSELHKANFASCWTAVYSVPHGSDWLMSLCGKTVMPSFQLRQYSQFWSLGFPSMDSCGIFGFWTFDFLSIGWTQHSINSSHIRNISGTTLPQLFVEPMNLGYEVI